MSNADRTMIDVKALRQDATYQVKYNEDANSNDYRTLDLEPTDLLTLLDALELAREALEEVDDCTRDASVGIGVRIALARINKMMGDGE